MSHRLITLLLALASLAPLTLRAENWPQWRGPFFNGSTTETGLPTQWSKTENVAWIAPLPGKGSSTPVVWGDSVFVTSPDTKTNLLLFCINTANGRVRWQQTVVAGGDFTKGKNNACSPSVVTDGRLAIATFATGDIAAFDFAGQKIWSRNLTTEYGKFSLMWIYGSSPLLYRGKLYVQVLQHDPPKYKHTLDKKPNRESFLLCLNPQTGKTLWRHVRKTDAVEESQESYATPLPYEGPRGTEIIVYGGDYVTGHRADTGAELWRCGSFNTQKEKVWRVITSPATSPGFIYLGLPKRHPFVALKADATGSVLPDAQTAWQLDDLMPDVCTPLTYFDKLFVLDGKYAWFYTRGAAQVQRIPAKNLDDLRSPLRFLLGHTQLEKELSHLTMAAAANGCFTLSGQPKGQEGRVLRLSLTVTAEGTITAIEAEENDGALTRFTFTGEQPNISIPPETFRFKAPQGVPVVDALPPV